MTTCSVLPVASQLHGTSTIADLLASLRPSLDAAHAVETRSVEGADPTKPLALLVLTGGTEHDVLTAWRARQQLVAGEPALLLVHPAHNSLPAAMEALARLQRDGARGRIVVLQPGEEAGRGTAFDARHELRDAIHDVAVWHAMRTARLGILGPPSDWLVASVPDPAAVGRRWGTTIVDHPIGDAIDRFVDNIDAPIAEPVTLRARHHDGEPHPADVETAARFEPVLRVLSRELGLDAVAVRCFDLVGEAHTSGCLALSWLNDHGIVAGCEGDVSSTMALLWLRHLVGRIGWMANPAMIDRDEGTVELAHCTVPLSLVRSFQLDTHFESGLGVGIDGTFEPGPVTVVRLGGRELELLWCADGEALPTQHRDGRCRTQLDVRIDPVLAGELLDHPLGNHLVVVPGHHADRIRRWWQEIIAG